MKINQFFILLALLALFFMSACKDDEPAELKPIQITTTAELSTFLEKVQTQYDVPGFSVSVALGNEIRFQQAFGYANLEQQIPYSNETLNSLASVSKTFVAAAALKAIEQGHFTLESSINELLPFELHHPHHSEQPILVKHLLTHTAGIIDSPDNYFINNYYILAQENLSTEAAMVLTDGLHMPQGEKLSLKDYIEAVFLADGSLSNSFSFSEAAPGQVWMYSNMATALMGYIIEYQTGQEFHAYVATQLLTPLQMSSSSYDIDAVDFSAVATRYLDGNRPLPRFANHGYVEGGLYSNNQEMGYYLLDMMRLARGENAILFASSYKDILFGQQLDEGMLPSGFADNQALFWFRKNDDLMHGGNDIGASSHLQLKQDGSAGFVIMSNMDGTFHGNNEAWLNVSNLITTAIQEYVKNNQ